MENMNNDKYVPVTLSDPRKIPCYSYSIPASACTTGSQLAKIPGSVCAGCYAHTGAYTCPVVQASMHKRLRAIEYASWVPDMVRLIGRREKSGFFRWHDSGDVQSKSHLHKIVEIARRLPDIRFWLPTKERDIVREYMHDLRRDGDLLPANLTIRISAPMVGRRVKPLVGTVTSSVVRAAADATCPATTTRKVCGDCRACWDPNVQNVAYKLH